MKERLIAAIVFVTVLVVHLASGVVTSTDSAWVVHTAASLAREGDVNLDEYENLVAADDYRIRRVNGHLHSYFPVGTSLITVPFVVAADHLAVYPSPAGTLSSYLAANPPYSDPVTTSLEHCVASILVAMAAAITYLTAKVFVDTAWAVSSALLFAFCTSAWSTASRALWQHGPSMLMLSATVYLLVTAWKSRYRVQYAAVPLALSYVIRPTNSISVLLITSYVFFRYRGRFLSFCLWGGTVALPFLMHNLAVHGAILPPYYLPGRITGSSHVWEALVGNLISPSRGLFVFSPVLVFAIHGAVLRLRCRLFCLSSFLVIAVLLHWLAVSLFPHWYGGYSIGPRFFTDVVPYLVYLLVPAIAVLRGARSMLQWGLRLCLVLTGLISIAIHGWCSINVQPYGWNDFPVSVDDRPDRVWDWKDPQFLRGLGPARLRIYPHAVYAVCHQDMSVARPSLAIRNVSPKSLTWHATVPHDVSLSSASGFVPAYTSREVSVCIQADSYPEGVHSLGGMSITAVDAASRTVRGTPAVVPVGLRILGAGSRIYLPFVTRGRGIGVSDGADGPFLAWERYIPPSDILVEGQAQTTSLQDLTAVHGTGWYPRERLEEATWRWARSPSTIHIRAPSVGFFCLELVIVNFHKPVESTDDTGVLRVTTDSRLPQALPIREGEPCTVQMALNKGWNTVQLELDAGNFRPINIDPGTGDARELSFAVRSIGVSTVMD